MCCGSRRSAWRNASAASASTSTSPSVRQGASERVGIPAAGPNPAATTAPGPFPSVALHYIESAALRVRGPVTGRLYDFSESHPVQAVDIRDAAVFLRNNSFRRSVP
jgi:hypothetical protein